MLHLLKCVHAAPVSPDEQSDFLDQSAVGCCGQALRVHVSQMFQFVTNMAQAAYCRLYSPYPKQLSTLLFFYMITLLALFLNFYLGKHGGASKKRQPAGQTNGRKKSV